jgi:hypothetical protein
MKLLTMAILLNTFYGPASFANTLTLKIDHETVSFFRDPNTLLVLSESCRFNCAAKKEAAPVKLNKIRIRNSGGGRNPGSVLCSAIGGEIWIGFEENKNQRSVCKFSDNSFVECGSLVKALSQNEANE